MPKDYKSMDAGEMLYQMGFDAENWADAFDQLQGPSKPDKATMIGWFANALMAGYDHCDRKSRDISEFLSSEDKEELAKGLEVYYG